MTFLGALGDYGGARSRSELGATFCGVGAGGRLVFVRELHHENQEVGGYGRKCLLNICTIGMKAFKDYEVQIGL